MIVRRNFVPVRKSFRNKFIPLLIANKNALSSVESRLLGDKFYCQLVLLCYFFVWNTKRVLYVVM